MASRKRKSYPKAGFASATRESFAPRQQRVNPLWGVPFLAFGALFVVALVDFEPSQTSQMVVGQEVTRNLAGSFGSWLGYSSFWLLGKLAWLMPLMCLSLGWLVLVRKAERITPATVCALLGLLCLSCGMTALVKTQTHTALTTPSKPSPLPEAKVRVIVNQEAPRLPKDSFNGIGGEIGTFLTQPFLMKSLGPVGLGIVIGCLQVLSAFAALRFPMAWIASQFKKRSAAPANTAREAGVSEPVKRVAAAKPPSTSRHLSMDRKESSEVPAPEAPALAAAKKTVEAPLAPLPEPVKPETPLRKAAPLPVSEAASMRLSPVESSPAEKPLASRFPTEKPAEKVIQPAKMPVPVLLNRSDLPKPEASPSDAVPVHPSFSLPKPPPAGFRRDPAPPVDAPPIPPLSRVPVARPTLPSGFDGVVTRTGFLLTRKPTAADSEDADEEAGETAESTDSVPEDTSSAPQIPSATVDPAVPPSTVVRPTPSAAAAAAALPEPVNDIREVFRELEDLSDFPEEPLDDLEEPEAEEEEHARASSLQQDDEETDEADESASPVEASEVASEGEEENSVADPEVETAPLTAKQPDAPLLTAPVSSAESSGSEAPATESLSRQTLPPFVVGGALIKPQPPLKPSSSSVLPLPSAPQPNPAPKAQSTAVPWPIAAVPLVQPAGGVVRGATGTAASGPLTSPASAQVPKPLSLSTQNPLKPMSQGVPSTTVPAFTPPAPVPVPPPAAPAVARSSVSVQQPAPAGAKPVTPLPVAKPVEPAREPEPPKAVESPLSIISYGSVEMINGHLPETRGNYTFPTIELLRKPPENADQPNTDPKEFEQTMVKLVETLDQFKVAVAPGEIHTGPVITRYEIVPAPGVRVEKIASLDKNLALGLRALAVRILAPVPGKGSVGVEVPNAKPSPVFMREIVQSRAWAEAKKEIPVVLGKDVTGKPIVEDLTKMPHMLIAGSTGSGKTVCINAIITSLLYHSSPDDLRFIMVDPKVVEMRVYNDLPHMLIPVVTDPKKVPGALKYLITEMERRYQIFAEAGVRNIAGFNKKILKDAEERSHAGKIDREITTAMSPEERNALNIKVPRDPSARLEMPTEKLPYIVCIIDELADLMMVAPQDIETGIARLAQLARAAGIHLILATQRPSVNVITGVIKANLPTRIAFKVSSQVDSRTILDQKGAETLIGRGDMLYVPPGSATMVRAQGAFVDDDEINGIVEYLKNHNDPPVYDESIQRQIEASVETDEEPDDEEAAGGEGADDELRNRALQIIKTTKRASTSSIQRRLKIGYNRAARIMDQLEDEGIVGPDNGSKPREILVDLDSLR